MADQEEFKSGTPCEDVDRASPGIAEAKERRS
jgi:hypothetical protein